MSEKKNITVSTGSGHIMQLTISGLFTITLTINYDGRQIFSQNLDYPDNRGVFQINENGNTVNYEIETKLKMNFNPFVWNRNFDFYNTIRRNGQIIYSD